MSFSFASAIKCVYVLKLPPKALDLAVVDYQWNLIFFYMQGNLIKLLKRRAWYSC